MLEGVSESRARAGCSVLSLLAVSLNVSILDAVAEEPLRLAELRRRIGSPPQTTLRGYLRKLTEIGVLEKSREEAFPGSVNYDLGSTGRELLKVTDALRLWLGERPGQPLALGEDATRSAICALAEGWRTRIVRALAARPLSLTELDELISGISYPSLERRLAEMRDAGLEEAARERGGRGTPYAPTDWLRRAVGPITVAAQWEQRYLRQEAMPVTNRDAEAAFLLAVPLVRLPPQTTGSCSLAIEVRSGSGISMAGAVAHVEQGEVVSCVSRLGGQLDAWVTGSSATWLSALTEPETGQLDLGGDRRLARELVDGLHTVLFRTRVPAL